MANDPEWRDYSPHFASHVKGKYERRQHDKATGMPLPQTIKMECTYPKCGEKWATVCSTGQVKAHIARFASRHLHRDPMGEPTWKPNQEPK